MEELRRIRRNADAFRTSAREVLALAESSPSRLITVDQTRRQLVGMSLRQDELIEEAIGCLERGYYRASHVLAWAAFIDFLELKLGADGLAKVHLMRPSWQKWRSIEDLRENIPEDQFIEVAREVGLLGKQETKAIRGLLAKRNECAHPSVYRPGLNEALGFISELLSRVKEMQPRTV